MDSSVTLITGTRRGIGRHLTEHYLEQGHSVVGCSRKPTDFKHPRYRHFELDVADEGPVCEMFSEVRKEYGRLDHLINNAGIASMNHSLLTPIATLVGVLKVNLIGSFLCSREAAKIMKRRRFGRIVNFTTVAVPLRLEGESAYVASKAGVEGLTRVLAGEFGALGITVNAVGPSPIDTDLTRSIPKTKLESLASRQAIRDEAKFDDVSNVIDFFLRAESRLVTGQIVYLGGL